MERGNAEPLGNKCAVVMSFSHPHKYFSQIDFSIIVLHFDLPIDYLSRVFKPNTYLHFLFYFNFFTLSIPGGLSRMGQFLVL